VGKRNAKKAEAARAVQILIRADGAGTEKNQRKGSQEFRNQLLRHAVHLDPPQQERKARSIRTDAF